LKSRRNSANDAVAENKDSRRKAVDFKKLQSSTRDDFFKSVGFCVGRGGTQLYIKTIERLGLCASTQFKNGSDLKK